MTFQEEHAEWLSRMFPNQPIDLPAAGLVEEAGELMHCLVKRRQEELWGKEPRYINTDWAEKLVDAIGDCAIYACSVCNALSVDYAQLLKHAKKSSFNPRSFKDGGLMKLGASLMNMAVNVVYAPLLHANLMLFLAVLVAIADELKIDFDEAVATTWKQVKERQR